MNDKTRIAVGRVLGKETETNVRACEKCRFVEDQGPHPQYINKHLLVCKFHPPVMVALPGDKPGQTMSTISWPIVGDDQWCYQFTPKEGDA